MCILNWLLLFASIYCYKIKFNKKKNLFDYEFYVDKINMYFKIKV